MAFPEYRGRRVYVHYWDSTSSQQKTLPRARTRHLDGEPDNVVREWVTRWENLHEVKKLRPELVTMPLPIKWYQYVEEFCAHLKTLGRASNTIKDHKRHLQTALPFFAESGCDALADFPKYSRRLGDWLLERGKSPRRVHAINQSISLFWDYLDLHRGLVEGALRLVGGIKTKQKTPLITTISPDEILAFGLFGAPDIRLIMLIGYFFSLRPQEVLALTPGHFKAGSRTEDLECCKAMEAAGLYSKLAVNVVKQKVGKTLKDPKKDSIGWVACFNEHAARFIISALRGRERDEPLFPSRTDAYFKKWRRKGLPQTVMKDMRRASLYHLGHYSDLPVVALKNHARHVSIETTMLYTRRPEELSVEDWVALDLDA